MVMTGQFSLDGRVALVTGASRGLGWAMAEALAEAGATLVLCGRDEAVLSERVDTLEARGTTANAAVFDMADRPAVAAEPGDRVAIWDRPDEDVVLLA